MIPANAILLVEDNEDDVFLMKHALNGAGVSNPVFVVETGQLTNPRYIINFPTKRHWRGKSRLADIDAGLVALVREVKVRGIASIAVPPLGCGLGGLDWGEVQPRIVRAFSALPDVRVMIFSPSRTPAAFYMARSRTAPSMTSGRAVLVKLIERYRAGLLDPFITLLEVQKLLYFAQEAGEPLRLRFVKAIYGPYAENLRQVLAQIEGHFVSGYLDGGDTPTKQLQLVPGATAEADACIQGTPETLTRIYRVGELVDGFETPFGMELLATVHWVVSRGKVAGDDAVVDAVHSWNERKRSFTPRQITIAADRLEAKGWLPVRS